MAGGGARSYDDPCGIARALDVVGERWALLVVRELLLGPKRFGQLRSGLHGVSQNVLSQRLRELEADGLVRRARLGPPVGSVVYELTDRGRELQPVLLALGRWGSRAPLRTRADLGPDAFVIALQTVFDAERAGDLRASVELRPGDDRFHVQIADGAIAVGRGSLDEPDAVLSGELGTLRSVAFGRQTVASATRSGELRVSGSRRIANRFATLFPVPRNAGSFARRIG